MPSTRESKQIELAKLKARAELLKLRQRKSEIEKAQEVSATVEKGIGQKALEFVSETVKDIALDAPEIAGSAVGAAVGAPFAAIPVIGPAIPPFASAVGQTAGELIKQTGQLGASLLGIDKIAGVPVNAPTSAEESRRRLKGEFASGLVFGGASRAARPLAKGGLNLGKKVGSKLSGVPEASFEALFARPGAILSAGKKKAGELFGSLTRKAKALGPEITEEGAEASTRKLAVEARKLFDQLPPGTPEKTRAAFALEARQLLDERLRQSSKKFLNTKAGRKLLDIRKRLNTAVKLDPDIAKADDIFRASSIAEPFRNILPITKGGGTGLLRTVAATGAGSVNPVLAGAFSPAVQGGLTLAAKGASAIADPLLSRPGLLATLVRAAQAVGQRDPNKGPGTSLVDSFTK